MNGEYDYSKLLGRMREHGYTQEKLAKEIGISACSVNFSLNNKRDFKQSEILKICDLLKIPSRSLEEYFFRQRIDDDTKPDMRKKRSARGGSTNASPQI